jgi:hypothetical protein
MEAAPILSRGPPKGPRLSRNDEIWESHKGEVYRIYITENNTLQVTMRKIEESRGFKASSVES